MAYTINKTNGDILATVPDQTVNQVSSSLTLIGKNYNAYGTYYNDNLIGLLENFANTTPPRSPLTGQIWFNTSAGRLYVFNESKQPRPVGGPIISNLQPVGPVAGDLWIDTINGQLKYYDGISGDFANAGKNYSDATGKAGFVIETLQDNSLGSHTVANLYNNGVLLAILSDTAFTLANTIGGLTAVVQGLNLVTTSVVKGTATNAGGVAGVDSAKITAFFNTATAVVTGTLVAIGAIDAVNGGIQLYNDNFTGNTVSSSTLEQDLTLQVSSANLGGSASAIRIKPATKQIGIWTDTPGKDSNNNYYALDIVGNTRIQGNVDIINNATNVEIKNLRVENKLIELAYPALPDVNLDGAGIVLHGSTDHTILYRPNNPGWEFNSNINITTPSSLYINGTQVFTAGGSGLVLSNITSAPDVTSIGTLTNVQVGNIEITTSTINTVNNGDLVLMNNNPVLGNINISGKKIINAKATLITDSTGTLATKGYVDSVQQIAASKKYVFTVDVTGKANIDSFIINSFLNVMLPPVDPVNSLYDIPDQAEARVNTLNYILPSLLTNVTFAGQYVSVDKGGVQNSQSVLYGTPGITVATQPGQQPVCVQHIYRYYVSGATWIPDPGNPIA
jgi:hypothetical protein